MAHRTGVPRTKQYLVARCPCCQRGLWPRQMAALLGFDPLAARRLATDQVAFVAETNPSRGGWHLLTALRDLAGLRSISTDAVEQLQRLARLTLDRMWSRGLIVRADLEALLNERRVAAPPTVARETAAVADVIGSLGRSGGYRTSREELKL